MLDPLDFKVGDYDPLSDTWTDYDGDEPYGDYDVTQPLWIPPQEPIAPYATEKRSFEPGIGRAGDPFTTVGGANTAYYHADRIGTTRFLTNASGGKIEPGVYTAFGESITGSMTGEGQRYRYAGAFGYQAHTDFPFLHVGARYYDPSSGRFLQRDPIGIDDGSNVYDASGSGATLALVFPLLAMGGGGGNPGGSGSLHPSGAKEVAETLKMMLPKNGVRSLNQWNKHKAKLDAAKDLVKNLKDSLRNTTGKKARERVKDAIDWWEKKIKGHEKEMGQKWPELFDLLCG